MHKTEKNVEAVKLQPALARTGAGVKQHCSVRGLQAGDEPAADSVIRKVMCETQGMAPCQVKIGMPSKI